MLLKRSFARKLSTDDTTNIKSIKQATLTNETTNKRQTTNNKQQSTNQQATRNKQQANNKQRKTTTSNKEQATSNNQPTNQQTNNKQQATHNKQQTTNNKQHQHRHQQQRQTATTTTTTMIVRGLWLAWRDRFNNMIVEVKTNVSNVNCNVTFLFGASCELKRLAKTSRIYIYIYIGDGRIGHRPMT